MMYEIHILPILIFSFVGSSYAQERCRTPNGDNGVCLILDQCDPLNQLNQIEKKTPEDILYLRQSNCGLFMNIRPKVCCPPESTWSTFITVKPFVHPAFTTKPPKPVVTTSPKPKTTSNPDIDNSIPYGTPSFDQFECKPSIKPPMPDSLCCGVEASSDERILALPVKKKEMTITHLAITGGKHAKPDQYPWLALLEYNNTARRTVCGGALISARYVLTAAHCLGNTIWGTPVKVRLAEYNTTSYPIDEIFSDGGGVEYLTVVEIDIEKQIPHPGYKRYENIVDDIGLIKLARNAPYTDFIRPICLPIRDITTVPFKDISFFAAGWGSDGAKFNEIKTSIELPYVPLQQCQIPFQKKRNPVTLFDTHLCAGGEKDRDTCGGDSGGPLMYENGDTFIVVGIVSFGDKFCGTEGTPGVYTHVFKYIDWILKHMV